MRELRLRPAIIIGLISIVWSIFYSLFIYEPFSINIPPKSVIAIEGVVEDKIIDSEGNINSLNVKSDMGNARSAGIICYVNDNAGSHGIGNGEPGDSSNSFEQVPIGSKVQVVGEFGQFKKAGNPGEFDSEKYYRSKGYEFYVNTIDIKVKSGSSNTIKEKLFKFRRHLCDIVRENCPIEGGTINTLLFGDKTGLSDERKDLYRASGFSHFLVISGLHIFIAGGGIYRLLKNTGMKRGLAATAGIGFILFYGALVGFGISVFRAVFMFLIRLVSDILNRTYDMLSALFLAMSVSLFYNPLCVFDSAFLYSYGAVLFTGLFFTYYRKELITILYSRVYSRDGIRMKLADFGLAAMVPIIIYIGLLPLTLYFQSYSTVLSIALNMIMGLITTPILITGAGGFLFGMLNVPLLAKTFDFLCAVLLRITDGLSKLISGIRCCQIVYKPTALRVFAFYIVIFLWMFLWRKKLSLIYTIFLVVSLILFVGKPIYQPLEVYITNIGQGDGIIVRTGMNKAIINDFGSSSKSNIGKNVLIPFLKAKGITEIEDIFLSHGDADHINGIEELLENGQQNGIRVNRVLLPRLPEACMDESLLGIALSAMARGIKVEMISQGALIDYGAVKVSCLWPAGEDSLLSDGNSNSMVLWVNCKNFDMLLTADATKETEKKLIDYMAKNIQDEQPGNIKVRALKNDMNGIYTYDGHIDVYKCAHHGSSTSNSAAILEFLKPDIAVVSAGKGNRYGHPHEETLKNLEKINAVILRTDEMGEIEIKIDMKGRTGVTIP